MSASHLIYPNTLSFDCVLSSRNTPVNFRDKFYVYQGAAKGQDLLEEDVALVSSAFKSAFLADLVA
eukprot:2032936-Ditylum_brightwellii.AAC.1